MASTSLAAALRRKKSNLPELKIAVVGAPSVGKTALIVRFLTKRYIGEYEHRPESRYKYETVIDGEVVTFEILDTASREQTFTNAADIVQRSDGLLLVFSMSDAYSLNYLRGAKQHLQADIPMYLVANKTDLLHLRRIPASDIRELVEELNCQYSELSAAEQVEPVAEVFSELCREIVSSKRKSRPGFFGRIIGGTRPYGRGKSDSSLPKD